MKIISGVLLLFFGLAATLNAQETEDSQKKGFITISIGPAFAVGDFGNTEANEEEAGVATTGVNISLISFGYLFSENIGISALWAGSAHPIDKDAFPFTIENDPLWRYGTLMVGPLISLPSENGKSAFDIRAMVGFLTANSPELESRTGSLESFEGSTSAFSLGIGGRFHMSEKISFSTALDYISSKPEFEDGNFEQSITSINLTAGISFRLN